MMLGGYEEVLITRDLTPEELFRRKVTESIICTAKYDYELNEVILTHPNTGEIVKRRPIGHKEQLPLW